MKINNVKKLVTFGCSFTEGHHFHEQNKAWGDYLAKELNLPHLNLGDGGSSNTQIIQNILRFCENIENYKLEEQYNHCELKADGIKPLKPEEYLIGIQLSELSRIQWWYEPHQRFWSTPLNAVFHDWGDYEGWGDDKYFFQHMNKGKETLLPLFSNLRVSAFQTISNILLISNYLQNKGYNFFIFEGMNSIKDIQPIKNNEDECHEFYYLTPFLFEDFVDKILNSEYFFNELNLPMNVHMLDHPLYNGEENDNHPNPAYAEWYAKQIYNWLQND